MAERVSSYGATQWTKEGVVERIQTWAKDMGDPPTQTDWNPARARMHAQAALGKASSWADRIARFETGEWPSDWTVRKLFGSFSSALEQAGIESRPLGRTPRELTERQVAALRQRNRGEPAGPSQLAVKLKAVTSARHGGDKLALKAALFDLAAAAMAWCEVVDV